MVPNFNFDGGKIGPIGVGVGLSVEMARRGIQNRQKFQQKRAELSVTISQNFKDKKISEKVALRAYQDSGFSKTEAKELVETMQMQKTQESIKSKGGGGFYSVSVSNGIREYKYDLNVKQCCLKIYTKNDTDLLEISDLPYTVAKTTIDCLKLDEKLKNQLIFDIRVSQTFSTHELMPEIAPRFYIYDTSETWPSLLIAFTSILSICSLFISKFIKRQKRTSYR